MCPARLVPPLLVRSQVHVRAALTRWTAGEIPTRVNDLSPRSAMLLPSCAVLIAALTSATPPPADTIYLEVGSPLVNASLFKPHAARVRVYTGPGAGTLTAEWDNELTLGDSAGRKVMRWITTGRLVEGNPNRPLGRIFQTYDAVTLQPYGYVSMANNGSFVQLAIDGKKVKGVRRMNATAPVQEVEFELDVPGWVIGASDLVPVAAGLKTGQVMGAPLWGPNMTKAEYRVFVVLGDTTMSIEGTRVTSRKVEERRRGDGSLAATWYLTLDEPYMWYGEVPLANGTIQRMTEVPIPPLGRR